MIIEQEKRKEVAMNDYGLSPKTIEKVDAFLKIYPEAAYGPAHIALDDLNLLDSNILFCVHELNRKINEYQATKEFLFDLLSVPEGKR